MGIQLYTVRRLMAADPDGTLAQLAGIGFSEVELHSLYGQSARAFRKLLDMHGLKAPATHAGLDLLRNQLPRVLEEAATLGHRWIILPWLPPIERTPERRRRLADFLNETGAKVQQSGLRMGYHNEGYDTPRDLDLLLANTDPELVDFELDLFWARRGGIDPVAVFDRFPRRFAAVHVKDMAEDGKMVNVGAGTTDFKRILERAAGAGVTHFFAEHDEPANPLNDARASFQTINRLLNSQVP